MKPEETHRWWPGLASRVYKMVIIAGPGGREEAEGGGKIRGWRPAWEFLAFSYEPSERS